MHHYKTDQHDYYRVLGVDSNAGAAAIKRAYRARARELHPDFGGSVRQMKLVNEAYAVLMDPIARRAYDSEHSAIERELAASVSATRDSFYPIHSQQQAGMIRWLVVRGTCSFLVMFLCFGSAESPSLTRHTLYSWLLRGLAALSLLLGSLMFVTAHRLSQAQSPDLLRYQPHLRAYRITFAFALIALMLIVIADPFLVQR